MFMNNTNTGFKVWRIWFLLIILLEALSVTSENQSSINSGPLGNVVEQIVGGKVAQPGSTPWLASLKDTQYDSPVHFCGGAILSEYWVLTAARCIIGYDPPYFDVMVVLGEYDLEQPDAVWESEKMIMQVVIHPDYDYFTHKYDIALLQVYPSIDFNPRVQPLPFYNSHGYGAPTHPLGNPAPDYAVKTALSDPCHAWISGLAVKPDIETLGYIAGWGRTEENGDLTNLVHEAYVPIVDNEVCQLIYPGFDVGTMICAGNLTYGGVDPCFGDWGGPMVDSKGYLTGIASWAVGCGRPGYPAVYVNALVVIEWICSIITGRDD